MSTAPNYLASVRFALDIPERRAEEIVGRPDDETPEWAHALETALGERPDLLAEFYTNEPDVEVT